MAAMITRRKMPEPRERPRKIRSPGRVAPRLALVGAATGGPGAGEVLRCSVSICPSGFSGLRSRKGWRLQAAVHRTVRPASVRRAAHSGQLRLEMVVRTLEMISSGIGAYLASVSSF
uniref:Uncharacterized protein n=1 Tax=Streptomyces avermitilis TaxID=33903 RepID=A0A499VQU1_STRAX|nr:hypothetical protein SAVMC3_46700 [Streptomyces avermitilis]